MLSLIQPTGLQSFAFGQEQTFTIDAELSFNAIQKLFFMHIYMLFRLEKQGLKGILSKEFSQNCKISRPK